MTTYLDASVVLRIVLRRPDALPGWSALKSCVSSELVEVECLRTIDRLRIRHGLPDRVVVERRHAVYEVLEAVEQVA